jgi:hypothetical protein
MKNSLRYGMPLLAGLNLLCQHAAGQASRPDSSLVAAAIYRLGQRYTTAIGSESRLYNGPEYVDYVLPGTQGHRFFGTAEARPASISYAGHTYTGVPLRYDLVRGQLVVLAPGSGLALQLLNERVAGFSLDGHSFIRLVTDSSGNSPVRTGFYDLLVDGPVQLLASHHKTLERRAGERSVESEITARDTYFLHKDQHYYPLAKATELFRLFPKDKAALRQFSKDNKLSFRAEAREQSLSALVRYQATLAKSSP